MEIENSKAQMKKGILELCILALVEKEKLYASELMQKLKDVELIIVEGTLYPLLTRLKNDGYVTYSWEESKSGPPRKYFVITDSGRAFLAELKTSWNDLVLSIQKII